MLVIWLGALLVLGGLVFMMAQPIWRGRLSDATKRTSSGVPRDTLEPRRPGAGFTLKANWPGLVFIVLGSMIRSGCRIIAGTMLVMADGQRDAAEIVAACSSLVPGQVR